MTFIRLLQASATLTRDGEILLCVFSKREYVRLITWLNVVSKTSYPKCRMPKCCILNVVIPKRRILNVVLPKHRKPKSRISKMSYAKTLDRPRWVRTRTRRMAPRRSRMATKWPSRIISDNGDTPSDAGDKKKTQAKLTRFDLLKHAFFFVGPFSKRIMENQWNGS